MKGFYHFLYIVARPFIGIWHPLRITGRERVPGGPAIICANHSNMVDPFLVAFALGYDHFLRFMAKKELRGIPVIGWLLRKAGVFFVDRGASDVEAIRTAMKTLKAGDKVMMFPEGTRVSRDDAVAAKTGAVRLASKLNVPILPVFVPREKKPFHRLHVVVGEPYTIDKESGADSEACAAELMCRIAGLGAVSE